MYFIICAISAIVISLSFNTIFVAGDTYSSTINFYHGASVGTFSSYDLATAENVANHANFNTTRKTMLFLHGYAQSPYTSQSQSFVQAYIINGRYNILLLNWSQVASETLDSAIAKVDSLGSEVAGFIFRITKWKGVPLPSVHVVGHSLGAQVAGAAGKYIKLWSNNTESIDRITGLDPAAAYVDQLNWQKARFNDNIHTDNGFLGLGTNQNVGHLNFLPNGGYAVQPGCTFSTLACSHFRSMVYWSESVQRKDHVSFLSKKSDNSSIEIQMGNNCPTFGIPSGIYVLETNNATWFSKS